MSGAYVDSSCFIAVILGEATARDTLAELDRHGELLTSSLTEAEVRSTVLREGVDAVPDLLSEIGWILPDRPLTGEITRALDHGYLRGADLLHVATALFLSPDPREMPFITLDRRQREVAAALGFPTPL